MLGRLIIAVHAVRAALQGRQQAIHGSCWSRRRSRGTGISLCCVVPRLPDKVAADGVGELAFVGYADVGRLNTVYEMYRWGGAELPLCIWYSKLTPRHALTREVVWRLRLSILLGCASS